MDAQPDPADRGRPLRIREVVERIGAGRTTVRALISAGTLPAFRHGGATSPWLVYERDVDHYVAQQQESNT